MKIKRFKIFLEKFEDSKVLSDIVNPKMQWPKEN